VSGTHLESFKPVLTYMGVYLGNKQTAGSRNAMAGSFPWAIGDRGGWPNLGHTRARNKEPGCNDLEDKVQHDLKLGPLSSLYSQFQHIKMLNLNYILILVEKQKQGIAAGFNGLTHCNRD